MSKQLTILVACGSGVATSTIAVGMVHDILEKAQVSHKIIKTTLGEIDAMQDDVDLILTTANYKKPLRTPHMSVFSLISGINAEATEEKLVAKCRELQG